MYVCIRTAGNVGGGEIQGYERSRRQHNNLIWFLEQMVQGPCEGISWCLGVIHSYDNLPIRLHCCSKQKIPKNNTEKVPKTLKIYHKFFSSQSNPEAHVLLIRIQIGLHIYGYS
jgi:hypothetical protein